MTDEQWEELGRRAVACKDWRWMPGMRAVHRQDGSLGVVTVYHPQTSNSAPRVIHCGGNRWDMSLHGPYWPSLRDPATLGCLLALVREAWGDEGRVIHSGVRAWATEGGALVAALEAAP
jgi:hypothetical protein